MDSVITAAAQANREGVLLRAAGGREDLLDLHALHALAEEVTVDGVAIAEELGRSGIVREGVHDLLSGPSSGGMHGDIEVQHSAPMVSEDDEDEEHTHLSGGSPLGDQPGDRRIPRLPSRRTMSRKACSTGDGAPLHQTITNCVTGRSRSGR